MGAPSQDIQTFIHTTIVKNEKDWQTYKAEAVKHPTPEDLKAIRRFADQVIKSVK